MVAHPTYLPRAFDALLTWATDFILYLEDKDVSTRLELDTTRIQTLRTMIDAYRLACETANLHNAGSVDFLDRRQKADSLSEAIRQYVNTFLRYNEKITDNDRMSLGLTIPDTTPTHEDDPEEFPEIDPDTSVLRRVSCRFLNREHHASKPPHVHGTELRSGFIPRGETPSLSHLTVSSFTTRSSITLDYSDEERGLLVGLCARYENNTGGKGPFGPIITIFIP
ncbi:MAG: hypothetical protein LBK07_05145 [Tannerella sp.]|jgi:hypothetical protein|nr:hypothetical protein [Tannerella sp.]